MGKNNRSTISRSGSCGSTTPGKFRRTNASWKVRQRGPSPPNSSDRRWHSAPATARFATRKASSASSSTTRAAMPRSIRSAACPARRSSSSAVFRLSSLRSAMSRRFKPIHRRYSSTSGRKSTSAAVPSARSPRTSIESSASRTSTVRVLSTVAFGIQVERNTWHLPSTSSQSAETPCPVAYSGVSA